MKYENTKMCNSDIFCRLGDALTFHQGCSFTTKDKGNDNSSQNCAHQYGGTFWYAGCHKANLNGFYLNGSHTTYADGVN